MTKLKSKYVSVLSLLVLTACGGSSGGGQDTGRLTLGITDGPVEQADAVVVSFTSVELQGPERKLVEFDTAKTINLLDYQGENQLLLLDDTALPAGEYQWMRLGVDESASYIEILGRQFPLQIPSGAQTGLKLNRSFTLAAGGISNFTIDFDLRKSVHQEGTGDYKLRPTLRLVDNLQAGTIMGTVDDSLVIAETCNNGENDDMGNAVYLFAGANAAVQDLQGNAGDALASATVSYNSTSQAYEFTIGFVAVGDYTVAFTCDASLDVNTEDNSDVVKFTLGQNVQVTTDADTVANFVAP